MPAISIVMPVYNSSLYLDEAIKSLLNQSFTDFELIIINDGSKDNSASIIKRYADRRIVFLNHNDNIGYTTRLNEGFALATGKYIARMDADDISEPLRLELQFQYLEKHQNVAMCGTFIRTIGNVNVYQNWVKETDAEKLKINLLFSAGFCHPSVMIRKETLTKYKLTYDKNFEPAEDYWLWTKLSQVASIVNLGIPLLQYRISETQVSVLRNKQQKEKMEKIIREQLGCLELYPSYIEIKLHLMLSNSRVVLAPDYRTKIEMWTRKLSYANRRLKIYNAQKFDLYLEEILAENLLIFQKEFQRLALSKKILFYLKKGLGWKSITAFSFQQY